MDLNPGREHNSGGYGNPLQPNVYSFLPQLIVYVFNTGGGHSSGYGI